MQCHFISLIMLGSKGRQSNDSYTITRIPRKCAFKNEIEKDRFSCSEGIKQAVSVTVAPRENKIMH